VHEGHHTVTQKHFPEHICDYNTVKNTV